MAPGILSYFFCLIATKLNKYTYKALPTSLFFFMKPFVKSTPPSHHYFIQTTPLKTVSSLTLFYLCLCAPLSQFSATWPLEMQFCVIHLPTWNSTQPLVAFWALEFHSVCFVFSRTCVAPSSLFFQITLCWYVYISFVFPCHDC